MKPIDLTDEEFDRHIFQLIHLLRYYGLYNKKYKKQNRKRWDDYVITDSPYVMLDSFKKDSKELIEILNRCKSATYKLRTYFSIDKIVTYEDILNDWRLFFGLLSVHYLTSIRNIKISLIRDIMTDYLNIIDFCEKENCYI